MLFYADTQFFKFISPTCSAYKCYSQLRLCPIIVLILVMEYSFSWYFDILMSCMSACTQTTQTHTPTRVCVCDICVCIRANFVTFMLLEQSATRYFLYIKD